MVLARSSAALLLGRIESLRHSAVRARLYRNLFAFVLLIGFLLWLPNGLFGGRAVLSTEPLTGSFIAPSRPLVQLRPWAVWARVAVAAWRCRWRTGAPHPLQTPTNALAGRQTLALSLTLISGTTGQIRSAGGTARDRRLRLGAAGDRSGRADVRFDSVAGLVASALGTLLVFPAFRLRGHYIAIATTGDRGDRWV